MSKTKIKWADETWNPIVGCSKISEGCENCYAEKMARRQSFLRPGCEYDKVLQNCVWPSWNGKTALVGSALKKKFPGKGKRIFVCSMGDLFHPDVLHGWIDLVMNIIDENPQHTFIALTKRPIFMAEYFIKYTFPPKNLWLGVTAENQKQAKRRIPVLLQIPATKRFVSIEPMLSGVDIERFLDCSPEQAESHLARYGFSPRPLDWVICGGESGPKARPMHPDWVRSLRDQCKTAGVPFFFKQWGEWGLSSPLKNGKFDYSQSHTLANDGTLYKSYDLAYPDGARRSEALSKDHERANLNLVFRVGKKKAGKMLDGQEYIEVPE